MWSTRHWVFAGVMTSFRAKLVKISPFVSALTQKLRCCVRIAVPLIRGMLGSYRSNVKQTLAFTGAAPLGYLTEPVTDAYCALATGASPITNRNSVVAYLA